MHVVERLVIECESLTIAIVMTSFGPRRYHVWLHVVIFRERGRVPLVKWDFTFHWSGWTGDRTVVCSSLGPSETNQSDRVLIVIDGRNFLFSPSSLLCMG